MNATRGRRWSGVAVVVFSLATGTVSAQGSLTPPGSPGPTMKTLVQVEPRTPISSAGYTISQPGSYYLTTNLTCSAHGIIITASGVKLDLMGFRLTGDGESSDYGILLDGEPTAVISGTVVRNGSIDGFDQGIWAENCTSCRFEHLALTTNVNFGAFFMGGGGQCIGNTLIGCTIQGNGAGVCFWGNEGRCNGNALFDCTIAANRNDGTVIYGYSGQANGNRISNCTLVGNTTHGVSLYGGGNGRSTGNYVSDCVISGNGGYGIFMSGIPSGRCEGNTISGCVINDNGEIGIYLFYASGNRLENNNIASQKGSTTHGIYCSSTEKNLILRNTCVGQTNNYTMTSNDTYGPIVTDTGALSTTGAGAHPWANFSR